MPILQAPASLRHSITPCAEGYSLCVWEVASLTESRTKPFLYKANYRLTSKEEAQQLLRYYMEA